MCDLSKWKFVSPKGLHKGFYNEADLKATMEEIQYEDFDELAQGDDEFPCDSAYELFAGSCDSFARALHDRFKYNIYIIEGNESTSFHAFAQVYKEGVWYYIDARGITSSFDEFMSGAKLFVDDEYTIRRVTKEDEEKWNTSHPYSSLLLQFANAFITKYKTYYEL